jgi:DNA (cytosine-5)-methyltransferase 1
VSDTQAYKQFGNSVVVPVIEEVARIMAPRVIDLIEEDHAGVRQPSLLAG